MKRALKEIGSRSRFVTVGAYGGGLVPYVIMALAFGTARNNLFAVLAEVAVSAVCGIIGAEVGFALQAHVQRAA